jgi:hypothetical protein
MSSYSGREELATYCDLLFGAEPKPALIEVRFRLDSGRMGRRFVSIRPARGFPEWVMDLGKRTDVYIGVAPRIEQRGGRDAVARIHAAWADCDSPESIQALRNFRPNPSIVVRSGHGQHAYWSLWPPAGADAIERANRRIAHALEADSKATDAARVLRPPATFNYKTDPPRPVRIEHLDYEAVYTLAEVAGRLSDPPRAQGRDLTKITTRDEDDDLVAALRRIEPTDYVEILTGSSEAQRRPASYTGSALIPWRLAPGAAAKVIPSTMTPIDVPRRSVSAW